jgi:hypothetical protein
MGAKKLCSLADGHVQNIANRLALVLHLKRFSVVASPLAVLTDYVDVRQKVHLDLDGAIASAGLAASTLDVEGEATLQVATNFCLLGLSE